MKKLLFVLGLLASTTAFAWEADLFGIKLDPKTANDFTVTSYDKKEGFTYTTPKDSNDKLWATARVSDRVVDIRVVNESNLPIELNYFTDNFFIRTKSGKIFALEKFGAIGDYPSIVNPGDSASISTRLSSGTIPQGDFDRLVAVFSWGEVHLLPPAKRT